MQSFGVADFVSVATRAPARTRRRKKYRQMLPALESVFGDGFESSGSVQEEFVAARQFLGHPHWNKPF